MFNWNIVPRPEIIPYWERRFEEIFNKISALESYNSMMEKFLETTSGSTSIDENKNENNETEIIFSDFANIFRCSFLLQIIALAENEIKGICQLIETYNHQKFAISDLKGQSDLEKAKIYLSKTIRLEISNLNPQWELIKKCYLLRNSIMHNDSYFEENSKTHLFVKSNPSLKINGAIQIMKSPMQKIYSFRIEDTSLNSHLIESVRTMFEKIFDYIKEINTHKE